MARPAHLALRRRIIGACLKMNALALNQGMSGNISARVARGMLITPSGLPWDAMAPRDIVAVDGGGKPHGARAPSSEWRFHLDILAARPEIGAVLHAHPPFCTALACLQRDIPAFHYMVAVAGGDSIRCAPYATFGTQKLSDNALVALIGRRACLLANHGMIALGADAESALALAVEVETLAAQYCRALQIGQPEILPPGEMRTVLEKFRNYGQPDREDRDEFSPGRWPSPA